MVTLWGMGYEGDSWCYSLLLGRGDCSGVKFSFTIESSFSKFSRNFVIFSHSRWGFRSSWNFHHFDWRSNSVEIEISSRGFERRSRHYRNGHGNVIFGPFWVMFGVITL